MRHQEKFETEPDYDLTAWNKLIKYWFVFTSPAILLILSCIFKDEIDTFTKTIYFHAFLSYFLGLITLVLVIFGIRRTYYRFIKK